MSAHKHTPGPWMAICDGTSSEMQQGWGTWWIKNKYESPICLIRRAHVARTPEITDANARLIAAAPELFEALEDLMWRFVDDDKDINEPDEIAPDIAFARAALAKARGETEGQA